VITSQPESKGNKGFKNNDKKLWEKNTISDLNDAYYHAFLNSLQNNYKNIIIFEDDFFFDDKVLLAVLFTKILL
jgi:hypothetical protein